MKIYETPILFSVKGFKLQNDGSNPRFELFIEAHSEAEAFVRLDSCYADYADTNMPVKIKPTKESLAQIFKAGEVYK